MDFSNRNVRPQAASPGMQTTATGNSASDGGTKRASQQTADNGSWGRIGIALLGGAVVILLAAVIALIISDNQDRSTNANATKNSAATATTSEDGFVNTKELQAVFLNTGQVYFGHIKTLNSQFFVVSNIYYLQTAGDAADKTNANVSLVKLGCELHQPDDQMVINRDQVTFWENLHDSGQVAKAVAAFQKAHPKGQQCVDQSTSASNSSTNNVQSATPAKP